MPFESVEVQARVIREKRQGVALGSGRTDPACRRLRVSGGAASCCCGGRKAKGAFAVRRTAPRATRVVSEAIVHHVFKRCHNRENKREEGGTKPQAYMCKPAL